MNNKFAHDSHFADYEKSNLLNHQSSFVKNIRLETSDLMGNFSKTQK